MSDTDLIPPFLHARVAEIDTGPYAGKLKRALIPGERVELAAIGGFTQTHDPCTLATVRCKPALLVSTDHRLIVIHPDSRGLFGGAKSRAPEFAAYSPSNNDSVFDAGYVRTNPRRIAANTCGAAPSGTPGASLIWVLDVVDADYANLWAAQVRDNATIHGGVDRKPNGL